MWRGDGGAWCSASGAAIGCGAGGTVHMGGAGDGVQERGEGDRVQVVQFTWCTWCGA